VIFNNPITTKAMISRKNYIEAKKIVDQYEKEFERYEQLFKDVKTIFPINCFVVSKLNTAVRGSVVDYTTWSGIPQLLCVDRHGKKQRMLITNAVKI
jgi:hypothetical protein